MEPKKNPKSDLNKNRGLFFITGLMLVLALSYVALEWKTYDDHLAFSQYLTVDDPLDEPVELIEFKPPPPPKPPVAPTELDIVPDKTPIEETVISSTEPDEDKPIIEVDSIPEAEDPIEVDVTWVSIEEVPIFPGCESATDKRACFEKMIIKHVRKTQRYPDDAQEIGAQGRVSTMFTIEKDGTINGVRMRGPHKSLENEASRIISKLPKMTPGKQRGTPVKVSFSLPITFVLQ